MKHFVLSFFFLSFVFYSTGQTNDTDIARELVTKNSGAIGLTADDAGNFIISSSYFNKTAGTQMVYLIQSYLGLPVYNQMLVLAFKQGKLVSKAGNFLQGLEKLVNVHTAIAAVPAGNAVQSALTDRDLQSTEAPVIIENNKNGRYIRFNDMGISRENITAKLMWVPIEEQSDIEKVNSVDKVGKVNRVTKVKLAWQVYIIPITTPDYWLVKIDALNGSTLGVDNLTDYDNWGQPADNSTENSNRLFEIGIKNVDIDNDKVLDFKKITTLSASPDVLNAASYTVIPFPAESPQHPGGAVATRTNPWTAAPGNATSLKWHTGLAGVDYNYTRGNNVWAYQDRTAPLNTGSVAKSATSTTALPNLAFNFTPNFTVDPIQTTPVQNQQFNITNLFYWNNIIHDLMYLYGFDEGAANFQDNNQGRGGAGNDHVNAEAQDGGGTNNANFSTPADGSSGRMQMYLWTAPTPDRDGDVDNGIVVHEYGHGISNRLTGGGTGACLGNAEQMGEGWSDYYALMFTQDWAASTLTTGFTTPRGIGTYALNQPVTGTGIRSQKYCTNFSVNNKVYAATIPSAPHDRGEIWCATLWDMTWNIINQVGTINPNMFNVAAGGGNTIAMKLVTEGLKLQQCSPGFISGRNGILQADLNLYGGAYRCAIIAAFARRGMGTFASEGSTGSVTDQVPDFRGSDATILLTQNGMVSVPEGQNIVYNNSVSTGCNSVTNYTLRDTLPANVTFVSATNGGTYNAGNRVVSWPVNLAANATGNYGFTVNVNPGSYFPPVVLLTETVPATSISGSWSTASTTSSVWIAHNVRSKSAPNSFFTPNPAIVSDQTLTTTSGYALAATAPTLSFWHWYNTEGGYDGCVLEISTNGGSVWNDIGASNITKNGYNGIISNQYSNPVGGRNAWSGNSGSFIESRVNLSSYANQPNVKFRWRLGADNGVAAVGWNVDDIRLQNVALVNMQTVIFDNTGIKLTVSDTVTVITAGLPKITASAGANGLISDPGVSTVSIGGSKSYTITPNPGYAVADVLVDGVSVGAVTNYTFTNVTTDHTIVASFILNSYTIISSTGLNGNISPLGSTNVNPGGSQVYTFTPGACYGINDVLVDGVSVGPVASYTFTNVNANHTISVSFILTTYTITSTSGANGSVTPAGAFTVNCGANADYAITPAPCYHVQDVLADGVSVGAVATYTFTNVTANHTISASFALNTALIAPGPLTGPINVCPYIGTGQQISYSVPAQDDATYNWIVPPTITIVSGQGTNSVLVTIDNGFIQNSNKQIRVTALSSCGNSPQAVFILVAQLPATPSPITPGSNNVCPVIGNAGTITYTIPKISTASSYLWTTQSGTTTITHPNGAGPNDTTVTVSFTNGFSTSAISVQAVNICGTSGTRSLTISRNSPAAGPITGPTNACPYMLPNGTAASYSIVPVVTAATYNWTAPAGSVITHPNGAGANDYTITVQFPNGFTSGSITVSVTNGCGTSAVRTLAISKLNVASPPPIDVIQTDPCPNRIYTYTISTMPANASSVQWTIPAVASLLGGQGTTSITVSYPPTAINGAVTVQAVNNCGTSGIRSTGIKLPACPSPFAGVMSSNNGKGQSKESFESLLGIDALSVKVVPNPSVTDFKLQVVTPGKDVINVRILDLQGREFKRMTVMPYQTISLGYELMAGQYMIEVRQGKELKTTRVLKF